MSKIIFLDIDGVLNVIAQGRDEFGAMFHPEFVQNLKHIIIQTKADIVISSTWRSAGLEKMKLMWEIRDLPGKVVGITPNFRHTNAIRGEEVAEYIRENSIDKYCIIDDDADFLPDQLPYLVQTSENQDHPDCIDIGFGLTKLCSEKAIQILNNL